MKVRNPRTGKEDYRIKPLGAAPIEALADKLRAEQVAWAASDRKAALHALADAIERHADAITAALISDTGRAAISRIRSEERRVGKECA